ncbi:MAG TPA: tRNA (adenosine(37)-N6)-threonylcarbamoyltransferase complex ATPase subunit type 1 TsaE [Candidatus Paceibacterota bacterium]|mgnify:CR=1 FL=1|nr:tRNA (adenosine(37)-N6)-threonylcarbamoyltransferase complex ATPase subunit type 1 TsaE [Candidatus Paceibacterota bacterium]HMP18978.1 tRNA (adenosine(37)-N6)-threonylcarbamoyltransferase complex ATPase subunit type 1 TsaE [Candidatus Paceibacterota bacterium]HMP85408.1 tRNA (adenosine(37)-N6)-threonylcarbamoyltransferase complex ATPase subunit type 1 TsaE [Candidatus Paceibacterota bacterium]
MNFQLIKKEDFFEIKNESEMAIFSQKIFLHILNSVFNKKNETATVIALFGNLGSGKTTFTKYFVKNFEIKENVTSPTFVICKIFDIPNNFWQNNQSIFLKENNNDFENKIFFKKIYHFDMYRLKSSKELSVLNWIEIINNPENIIIVEWPDIIIDAMPKSFFKLSFEFINENQRNVKFESINL